MIRKSILISSLCLAVIAGSKAQSKFPQEVSVGASFGMNFCIRQLQSQGLSKMNRDQQRSGTALIQKESGLQTELNSATGWEEE